MKETNDELVTIPKGTLFHIEGLPFRMADDTRVEGSQVNLDLATRLKDGPKVKPESVEGS